MMKMNGVITIIIIILKIKVQLVQMNAAMKKMRRVKAIKIKFQKNTFNKIIIINLKKMV